MLTVLVILAVLLVVVMAISLMGAGPSRIVRRRTIVERRPVRRRVVDEPVRERVVEEDTEADPPLTRRIVD
jgi:CHASE3 domain sensor protein